MIHYADIPPAELDQIRALWERNRDFHVAMEADFRDLYQGLAFEARMKGITEGGCTAVKITVARSGNAVVGYCLSTLRGAVGELVSMHVADSMRGQGVGRELATRHLRWLREADCQEVSLVVSPRNRNAISFYESLGLRPCLLTMQWPRPGMEQALPEEDAPAGAITTIERTP